jgi:hypothetical protein
MKNAKQLFGLILAAVFKGAKAMINVKKGFSLMLAAVLVFSFLNTQVQAADNGNTWSDTIVRQISNGENIELHTAKELKTKNGIDIKVIDETGKQSKVEMTVPNLGSYDITVSRPYSSALFIVTKIVFNTDSSASSAADDLSAWLKKNTKIPANLPVVWQPVINGGTQAGTDKQYPYYYFELSGDEDSYGINVYRSEEKVGLNDQNGYIKNNGHPISESNYIGSISGEKITDKTSSLSVDVPQDAARFELVSGLTAYEKDNRTSVWWKDNGWNFEFSGSSAGIDTLKELVADWQKADIQVSQTGKVKIVEGNRFTFYCMWDKDGYRYEFTTRSTDFNEIINTLNSFTKIN